mgnify:CR=1 FL=1
MCVKIVLSNLCCWSRFLKKVIHVRTSISRERTPRIAIYVCMTPNCFGDHNREADKNIEYSKNHHRIANTKVIDIPIDSWFMFFIWPQHECHDLQENTPMHHKKIDQNIVQNKVNLFDCFFIFYLYGAWIVMVHTHYL